MAHRNRFKSYDFVFENMKLILYKRILIFQVRDFFRKNVVTFLMFRELTELGFIKLLFMRKNIWLSRL